MHGGNAARHRLLQRPLGAAVPGNRRQDDHDAAGSSGPLTRIRRPAALLGTRAQARENRIMSHPRSPESERALIADTLVLAYHDCTPIAYTNRPDQLRPTGPTGGTFNSYGLRSVR